jgi:hypothetical protein
MAKAFHSEGTPAEVTAALVELRKQDIEIERKKRKWGWSAGLSFLAGILLAGGMVLMQGPDTPGGKVFLALAGVAGAVFLVTLIVYFVYSGKDYDNRKLFMGLDALNFLGKDMPQKSRCVLDISFDNYRTHGTLLGKDGGGFFNPITIFTYEDPWFNFRGRLYDGNVFDLTINQLVKRKERRKRKGTKVKEKIREEVQLALKVDPETYGGIEAIDQKLQAGAEAAGLMIRKAVFESGKLKVNGRSGTVLQGAMYGDQSDKLMKADTVFQFLFHVYQALGECRPAAA